MGTLVADTLSVEKAEAMLKKWRWESSVVWEASDGDFKAYMDAIASMQSLYDKTSGDSVSASTRVLHESAKRLLAGELPKLEEGLAHLLVTHNTPVPPEKVYEAYKVSVEKARVFRIQEARLPAEERGLCFVPENALWRMHLIVRALLRRRLWKRAIRIMKGSRRLVLMESLRRLAKERFDARMVGLLKWDELQRRIEAWRQFVKVAVVALLASERRLCERIFNVPDLSEICFAEISLGAEKLLFDFIEAFASGKKAPERLFPLLEAYETLLQLQPTFDEVYAGHGPCKALRAELTVTMSRVGVAVRGVFKDFESNIREEPSKPPANASVHALTNYVVNYLNCLYAYRDILTKLYASTGNGVVPVPKLLRPAQDEDEDGDEYVEEYVEEESEDESQEFWGEPLPEYMEASMLIKAKLECLENALQEKARQHIKEPEKQHFFLMNNIHYMARKVKETDLRKVLGDDWIRDAAERVQEHANQYMRLSWNRVSSTLKDEGSSGGGLRAFSLKGGGGAKDKLAKFCAAFEEVYKVQCQWVVTRGSLLKELEQAVKRRIVPPYSDAFERHLGSGLGMKSVPKNVKHPSIINELINQIFEGKTDMY